MKKFQDVSGIPIFHVFNLVPKAGSALALPRCRFEVCDVHLA
jgi:hypothetical protein